MQLTAQWTAALMGHAARSGRPNEDSLLGGVASARMTWRDRRQALVGVAPLDKTVRKVTMEALTENQNQAWEDTMQWTAALMGHAARSGRPNEDSLLGGVASARMTWRDGRQALVGVAPLDKTVRKVTMEALTENQNQAWEDTMQLTADLTGHATQTGRLAEIGDGVPGVSVPSIHSIHSVAYAAAQRVSGVSVTAETVVSIPPLSMDQHAMVDRRARGQGRVPVRASFAAVASRPLGPACPTGDARRDARPRVGRHGPEDVAPAPVVMDDFAVTRPLEHVSGVAANPGRHGRVGRTPLHGQNAMVGRRARGRGRVPVRASFVADGGRPACPVGGVHRDAPALAGRAGPGGASRSPICIVRRPTGRPTRIGRFGWRWPGRSRKSSGMVLRHCVNELSARAVQTAFRYAPVFNGRKPSVTAGMSRMPSRRVIGIAIFGCA